MYELFHLLQGAVVNFYIVTSSCILISRYDLVLSFFSIHFYTNLLTAD
jgi:hypothetical protein